MSEFLGKYLDIKKGEKHTISTVHIPPLTIDYDIEESPLSIETAWKRHIVNKNSEHCCMSHHSNQNYCAFPFASHEKIVIVYDIEIHAELAHLTAKRVKKFTGGDDLFCN
jgi:hypothetical protein